ncbi:heterokaryon incompatibility protein [Hirsutella rhossiliensis]|uniref:Heterokaryon incompatibility protein (HET) domain-containing protein n=1 Tax=Hirsutella rhossiliensis TaxID=111463 RepID=A0A9P8N6E2_9HYPO|nr:heterokaryon incompatibility protein (HET) domain-containing protein [Hirsutella rhossiliensis]KAH0967817.1 heterokaryon incompatibility protein (HET) domain-containing protein [Hirsutella rhossiliensis]
MRLIRAATLDEPSGLVFKDFSPDDIKPYAILSHTWGDDEVIWANFVDGTATRKSSFDKVRYTCTQAVKDGLDWIWIDSCCIDKSSSAELSEAINSMYAWYKNSDVCYTYLSGVSAAADTSKTDGEFARCRWFTRGWTLQELLAPVDLVFFSQDWIKIGEKAALSRPLSVITGIDEGILTGARALESASVARRMSWAAHRRTTRPEDVAYCLMGVFGVNMPMLYGEGQRAFLRLQEEIMKQSDDQSLLAWVDVDASVDAYHGLLAKSPLNFAYSNSVFPYQDWEPRPPYQLTNRGLCIDLPMTRREEDSDSIFVAALDCPAPPDYEDSSFLAIYLKKISHGDQQFARVRVSQFAKVLERGERQTVYVRQNFSGIADSEGVFPEHVLQLRRGPAPSVYKLDRVIVDTGQQRYPIPVILSSRAIVREWIPPPKPAAFRDRKGIGQLAGVLLFTRNDDGERLLVMLGSIDGLRVGFHAMELQAPYSGGPEEETADLEFDALQNNFRPTPAGRELQLKYHRVGVHVDTVVVNATKFVLTDVSVEKTASSSRVEDAVQAMANVCDAAIGRGKLNEASQRADQKPKTKKSMIWKRLIPGKVPQ